MRFTTCILALAIACPAMAAEQTAFVPAPLVDLRAAPISPSVLTDSKKEDAAMLVLRAAKREGATTDAAFDALIARQKARDAALMQMIGPDSPVTYAVANALQKQYGAFLTSNVAPQSADALALQMVQSIFLNRRDDLASTQMLYDDTAWRESLRARLANGDRAELNVTLSDAKRAELKNTALYIHTPGNPDGKIEPAVHLLLTALAQQIGHAGLADITQPGLPVHALFHASLAKALPNDAGATEWLNEWLYLRAARARAVVEDFRPDGALMQEAVAQSETTRRARLTTPPAITYQP